jgi:hypothetical protein
MCACIDQFSKASKKWLKVKREEESLNLIRLRGKKWRVEFNLVKQENTKI